MKVYKNNFSNDNYFLKHKTYVLHIVLFLLINGLFIVKYVSRTNFNPVLILILYSIIFVTLYSIIIKIYIRKLSEKTIRIIYWSFVGIIILGILLLHKLIDPLTIQVDRWSAINNFISTLFQEKYPYLAQTHLGGYGSPFPFWQFFHIPFYLMGDVGLGLLFIFIILSFSLKWILNNYRKAFVFLFLILVSPAFWYEVLVRSDLMYNFILCFIIISLIHKIDNSINKNPLLLGILCGLFLSTRLSIVVPFAIYLIPDFWSSELKRKISFILAGLTTFLITFIPLLIWDFNALIFFEYNPFILQSRQGSIYEITFLIIMVFYFAFKWKKDFSKQFSYTGIALFLFVGVTFFHKMITDSFSNGLFSPRYDLTYFNMALPYIFYAIASKNSESASLASSH